MYEAFFNLKKKPFDLVPNPDFLFQSRSHRRAIIHLDYGIHERVGFILLTGEVGSGKTTIIRDLIKKQQDRVILSKIFNTCVTFEQFLTMVNDDFGLPVREKDRTSLLRDLNDFLIEQYSLGNKPTLIIDEAQNLTIELLEDIRMLSNLEADDAKLLQIIMVGQPELRKTLASPALLQLRQRISINCHLFPLSCVEVEEYILHRLEVAGNRHAVTFSPESVEIIHRYSRGIPRLVNIICDFLMLSAFAEEATKIDEDMVRDVIGDLDFENQFWETGLLMKEAPPEQPNPLTQNTDNLILEMLQGITERLNMLERDSLEFRKNFVGAIIGKSSSIDNSNRGLLRDPGVLKTLLEMNGMESGIEQVEETNFPSTSRQQILLEALREKKLKSG